MTPEFLQVIIPTATAIVGALGSYLITKNTNKKDLTVSNRLSLSEDEKAFRKELRETIISYKLELEEAREDLKNLSEEVAQLHKINLELTLENKQLQVKVDELKNELQSFKKKKKGGYNEVD